MKVWNLKFDILEFNFAGVAQLVERQPSKLNVAGSNPVSRSRVYSKIDCFNETVDS